MYLICCSGLDFACNTTFDACMSLMSSDHRSITIDFTHRSKLIAQFFQHVSDTCVVQIVNSERLLVVCLVKTCTDYPKVLNIPPYT